MIISIFLENQGDKLQQQLIAQTWKSLCLNLLAVFPSPVMLKTQGKRKNASEQGFRVAKPSVMTPQWKMFPHTSQQRSHLMDHSQGFPLCSIPASPWDSSQHPSGIQILKMAKLCSMQPGPAGKERLERQEGQEGRPRMGKVPWGQSHLFSPWITHPNLLFAWGAQTRLGRACALLLVGFPTGISACSSEGDRDGHSKHTLPQLSPIPYSSSHSHSVFGYLFIIKEELGMTESKIFWQSLQISRECLTEVGEDGLWAKGWGQQKSQKFISKPVLSVWALITKHKNGN